MAYTIKTLHKSALPSGGNTSSGVAKNQKVKIVGIITITSYTTGGEVIRANDFGLTTLDFGVFEPQSLNATEPANRAPLGAQ
ncbi:hypothetical protein, partial [Staphylococcus aureus]